MDAPWKRKSEFYASFLQYVHISKGIPWENNQHTCHLDCLILVQNPIRNDPHRHTDYLIIFSKVLNVVAWIQFDAFMFTLQFELRRHEIKCASAPSSKETYNISTDTDLAPIKYVIRYACVHTLKRLSRMSLARAYRKSVRERKGEAKECLL